MADEADIGAVPSTLEAEAEAEAKRRAADPEEAKRERWRRQKATQRAARRPSDAPPAPARDPSSSGKAEPPPPKIDPRLAQKVTRWMAILEATGGGALAGGIRGAIEGGYKAYPLSPDESKSLNETSALYIEMRSQDMLEWVLGNPKIARWLPEIVLAGTCAALIIPRAIASVQDRRRARAAEMSAATHQEQGA